MFLEDFKNIDDIIKEYGGDGWLGQNTDVEEKIRKDLENAKIHLAWYAYGQCQGDSFVLYEKNDTLYEVNASHCSCRGLEGQWDPEETSWKSLKLRELDDKKTQEILQKLVSKYGER